MFHLAANPHYGFFRDELYFIVCGRHPAFGYVDQPPLVPLIAAGSQMFGHSLVALRAMAALCAGGSAAIVALLAREMGGGFFEAGLAALAASLAPVLALFGTVFVPDSPQILLWPAAVLCIARGRFGWAAVALAIATSAKYSAVMAGFALLGGVLIAGERRGLAARGFWTGMAVSAALLLPNAAWQWAHGWPMLELLRNGQLGKNVELSPFGFLGQQLAITNPLLAWVWVMGLMWCLVKPAWRWLGIGAIGLLGIMIALHGKAYYPAAIYPALFAAGAVAVGSVARGSLPRGVMLAEIVLGGAVLLPLVLPVLPEARLVAYQSFLARYSVAVPATENHRRALLGQTFADMHGWPELAAKVAAIRAALPDDVRKQARIFTANYGEAAAIDFFSPSGTPPVISGHNQYWVWGPRDWDGAALIDVGGNLDADRQLCGRAVAIGTFEDPWGMPYEDGLPIVLCRNLRVSVRSLWPTLKHYD